MESCWACFQPKLCAIFVPDQIVELKARLADTRLQVEEKTQHELLMSQHLKVAQNEAAFLSEKCRTESETLQHKVWTQQQCHESEICAVSDQIPTISFEMELH